MGGVLTLLTTLAWVGVMHLSLSSATLAVGEILSGPSVEEVELDLVFPRTHWLSEEVPDGMNLLKMWAGTVAS